MSRGYAAYIIMFFILGVGLWTTLTLGARLRAPQDISGQWMVAWDQQPATGAAAETALWAHQSGRYVALEFAGGPSLRLKMDGGQALGRSDPHFAVLSGDGWTVTLSPADSSGRHLMEMTGPERRTAVLSRPSPPGGDSGSPRRDQHR
jgi:hypothetical protein